MLIIVSHSLSCTSTTLKRKWHNCNGQTTSYVNNFSCVIAQKIVIIIIISKWVYVYTGHFCRDAVMQAQRMSLMNVHSVRHRYALIPWKQEHLSILHSEIRNWCRRYTNCNVLSLQWRSKAKRSSSWWMIKCPVCWPRMPDCVKRMITSRHV